MTIHKFDALSFLAGLIITGIGLVFLVTPRLADIVDLITGAGSWFWPAVFIVIGVAVLAPVATRTKTDTEVPSDQTGDRNTP